MRDARQAILWLRACAGFLAVALTVVLCRALTALPWPVDFALAVAATLIWSYRFEREPSDRTGHGTSTRS